MADVRSVIRMSEAEVWAFLQQARSLQVATLNRDGSAHLTTLWFAVDEGSIVFDTYAKSQKAVNIERDPRVALLAESGATYQTLRGVSVNGVASLVTDRTQSVRLKVAIGRRYSPDTPVADLEAQAAASRGKRVVFRVEPEKIVSWDHRKLAG